VGIATQDPELRAKFAGEPESVINYFFMVAEELREIMAQLGVRTVEDMIGRVDLLDARHVVSHWKASGIDLSRLLHRVPVAEGKSLHVTETQSHGLEKALDNMLIHHAQTALEKGTPVVIESDVCNVNRTVGALLSAVVAKRYGHAGLPADTIAIKLKGVAGQSFGAFLAHGVSLELVGDANDFVQFAIKNLNSGSNASTDLIAYASNGDNDSGWIDLGITGENFDDPEFGVTGRDDGYIFMSAPIGTPGDGSLYIATDGTGQKNDLVFSTGGFSDSTFERMRIIGTDRVGKPAGVEIYISTNATSTSTGALRVQGGMGLQGNLFVGGNFNLTGNITIGGTGSTTSTSTLIIENPISFLAKANNGDTQDIGIVGQYKIGSNVFAGVVRDSTTKSFRFFDGLSTRPTTTVAWNGTTAANVYMGQLLIANTTTSTSTTTGALQVRGGMGVSGTIQAGGDVNFSSNTQAANDTTGALRVKGGISVETGSIYVGGAAGVAVDARGIIRPTANITLKLGSTTGYWNDFYAKTAFHDRLAIGGQGSTFASTITSTGNVVAASGTASSNTTTGALVVVGGAGISGASNFGANITVTGYLMPSANLTYDIGSGTTWWRTFYGVSTQAKYADLAENYQSDAPYEAGTVLEFGGEKEVTIATDGTKRVAGVISTNPAHLMNGSLTGQNVVALALQGRVPCKVTGPIQKGDLMISAGFGYARANNDAQIGQVIGKALADFSGAKGMIEIVVGRV
jgi:hypothetical protein